MQTANILLGIGGGRDNTVPKYGVTAAEIAVLRAIHGEDSVQEVEPAKDVERKNRAELARLHSIYGQTAGPDGQSVVSSLFPGAAARVFESLDELDIPSEFYKAESRAKPRPTDDTDGKEKSVDDMTVPELKAYAATNGIELGDASKKADILAAIKNAADNDAGGADDTAEDDDGIGEMAPPSGGVLE